MSSTDLSGLQAKEIGEACPQCQTRPHETDGLRHPKLGGYTVTAKVQSEQQNMLSLLA